MNQDQFAHITDQELLGKYYAGQNNYWLGLLLQRYTMLLFGVCMKYLKNEEEARDGVQQVFLKVIQELPKYKVDYFKSWLYMVAKNYCLMKLRSKNGKTTEIKETMVATPAEDSSMQNHLEKDRQLELMSESLDELSKEQKLCVTLFYLDKKSYQEIADQTGFSMMQVKSYIQNGKRNLKINMEKKLKH
ncbi:RNA polymerase sigma factor [Pseudoflavitalea rhizosphaerae]|uniref:RNA polymerase sigma factor n=1 Tax=Pseudoflavitalea rhizosphaerae TaxID=1884793 RepID=UPI001F497751|nr:sigma-70 family RNA polymerase sigma factor [Pseudoflavitalea rhizosphaerae]